MKVANRKQSTNIMDIREGTAGFEKWVGKSQTYNNYEKKERKPTSRRKTGNDSFPSRSEKNKRNNRQR